MTSSTASSGGLAINPTARLHPPVKTGGFGDCLIKKDMRENYFS